jgi:hypothetical protein
MALSMTPDWSRVFDRFAKCGGHGRRGVGCRALHDWLSDMKLFPVGEFAVSDRYVGYYNRMQRVTPSLIAISNFGGDSRRRAHFYSGRHEFARRD